MKVRLSKDFIFESAQMLPRVPPEHRCSKLHGHTFKIEVSVEGEVDPDSGWLYDHARISEVVRPFVNQLDHVYLNEVDGLDNPTIENLAAWFWNRIKPELPELCEIAIHETPTARCVYRGE
jgi:6-pyruvoyltetrahydropterin/6-carboxytetrahydropterin synthase